MMIAQSAIPIVGILFVLGFIFAVVLSIVVLTTVSRETRNKLLIAGAIAIPVAAVLLFAFAFVVFATLAVNPGENIPTAPAEAGSYDSHSDGINVDPSRYIASEVHGGELTSQHLTGWTVLSRVAIGFGALLVVGSLCPLLVMWLSSEGSTGGNRARSFAKGMATAGTLAIVSGVMLVAAANVTGSGNAPSFTWLASTSDPTTFTPAIQLTWSVIALAIGAILVAQFALRKAEAFVFWKTPWKPAGAIASASVLAVVGSVFVLKTPNPAHRIALDVAPDFAEYVDRRFGVDGAVTQGQRDLLTMSTEGQLSDNDARTPNFEVIGKLPYGAPSEKNSSYAKSFTFSSGRAGEPAAEGVWEPLLCSDEIYRVSETSAIGKPVFDIDQVPVSHEETDPIGDADLVLLGDSNPVALSAVASGQFTTVIEAWDDLLKKLRKRVAAENPEADPQFYPQMATRGLHNAVTRLAVSRRPLILENELEDDLVQPMYRVHVAIKESSWKTTTDPRSFAMGAGRERSMILIAALAGITVVLGFAASVSRKEPDKEPIAAA